jgi:ketosteroid isomerase-like protein
MKIGIVGTGNMGRSRSGNHEGFLSFCADDMEWTFVGDKTLKGKEAVRQWMATTAELSKLPEEELAELVNPGIAPRRHLYPK